MLTSAHARVNWITSIPATARGRTWSPKLIWQTQQTGTFTSPTITNRDLLSSLLKLELWGPIMTQQFGFGFVSAFHLYSENLKCKA